MPPALGSLAPTAALAKELARSARRGDLALQSLAFAEGPHLLDELLKDPSQVVAIYATPARAALLPGGTPQVFEVPDSWLARIATTEQPQGVIALVRWRQHQAEQLLNAKAPIAILDGLQDPGNVGTILRSAEAFGISAVLTLPGTARPYHPKVLRASAGSAFRVPTAPVTLDQLRSSSRELIAAVPQAERTAWTQHLDTAIGIVIGNEAAGISSELVSLTTPLAIPTRGVESLNAGVAASILFYELYRQNHGPFRSATAS